LSGLAGEKFPPDCLEVPDETGAKRRKVREKNLVAREKIRARYHWSQFGD
jgi:hypothetical protein